MGNRRTSLAITAAIGLVAAAMLSSCGLADSSTCSDFSKASENDQRGAVKNILGEHGLPTGNLTVGFARDAYAVYCGANPTMTLQGAYLDLEQHLTSGQ